MADQVRMAQREIQKLEEVLERDPNFRKWKKWTALLDEYRAEAVVTLAPEKAASLTKPVIASEVTKTTVPEKPKSNSQEIVEEAVKYLRGIRRRAKAKDITQVVLDAGVSVNGTDKAATVSAHLSNAKSIFDNLRGYGYGLVEWSAPAGTSNGANYPDADSKAH